MSNETTPPQTAPVEVDKPMWGIAQITWAIAWIEQFITTISAPLLTFVAVLTVASAFQGGKLIDNSPELTQAYSWSLGIGIEGQLAAMAYNARRAAVNGKGGSAVFYWIVTLILYLVGVLTGGIIAYQEANQVSFDQALKAVGVPTFLWDWGRVVVMFGLIVLAAATRYVKPAPQLSTEEELAKIEREARISAAKRELAAQRLQGFGGIVRGGINGVTGRANTPADATEIPETVTAFASQETGELPNSDGVITAEPRPISGLAEKGNWWDAQSYIDYVAFQYGIAVPPKKAQEVIDLVGKKKRIQRIGAAGKPSAFARISALKAYAKREYPPVNIPATSGVFSEQMAE